MSTIKEHYQYLSPRGETLADVVILAQAWKKTHHYIRQHNWHADVLELDTSLVNIESDLSVWKEHLTSASFKTGDLLLVPAPKNSRWKFTVPPDLGNIENLLDAPLDELTSEPTFCDWIPCVCQEPEATQENDEEQISQKLRPLAHLSIRDQTLATTVMMCLANAVETEQGNPSDNDVTSETKHDVVSYGNRLQCRWSSSKDKRARASFSWGNNRSYRQYFHDYRMFLARPQKKCADAVGSLTSGKDLYVVSLDIRSFFDNIDVKALLRELKRIELKYREEFDLPEQQAADERFWILAERILDWRWRDEDQKQAELIFGRGVTTLELGLPQGLMASGFLANAYMVSFDQAMQRAVLEKQTIDANVGILDYCRYVDDLRIVVAAPRPSNSVGQKTIQELVERFVAQKLDEHCKRINSSDVKPLNLATQKSKITPYRSISVKNSLSGLMEMLNAELSGTFDFQSLTQAAGGLEGLLWMSDQIEAADDPVRSRLGLSAIVLPPTDVRDDTLKRFVATRLAQSLRQRLSMTDTSESDTDHTEIFNDTVSDGIAIAHEFESTARKLIKCWADNPSLALLLRSGLDLFPHPRLLLPVIEALSVKIFDVSPLGHLGDRRQIRTAEYVASDLLRAGYQETGLRSREDYPKFVDIEGYREELAAFARRLVRSETPWYVIQQAYMYLASVGDLSLVTCRDVIPPEAAKYRELMHMMLYKPLHSEEMVNALPAALVAQQLSPSARRFGLWIQEGLKKTRDEEIQRKIITLIAMNRPDLLEPVLSSRMAIGWRKFAPAVLRELSGRTPLRRTKRAAAKTSSLLHLIMHQDNVFGQENALLLLARSLLNTDDIAQHLKRGLAITDITATCHDWGRISELPEEQGFLTVQVVAPTEEPCYLYKKPDWVADDKAWLYGFGRILRSAITGEPDFTARRYLITEEVNRYKGLRSSWSKRRLGLLNSARGLIDEPSPVSPWLSSFLSCLLQWPGVDMAKDNATAAADAKTPGDLLQLIESRIAEQRMIFGRRSRTPMYVIPVDESAILEDRVIRIAVVQPMRPRLDDFDHNDPAHWTPLILSEHRRHLAEVCRLAQQSLRAWHSSRATANNAPTAKAIVDLVLFPELAIHPEHIFLLRRLADKLGASIFAGLTFIKSKKLLAPINQGLWLIRTASPENGRSFQYVWQGKKYPTEAEKKIGVKSYRPHITLVEFPIGSKTPTRVAAAICYDATDLDLAADLRDRSDVFLVAAMNQDVQTFDNMVSALHFHMYQPVVLANSGEFGGSTAQAPLPKHERLITHLHGSNQVGVSVFEINPTPFKSFKSIKSVKSVSELKTSPAGYMGRV